MSKKSTIVIAIVLALLAVCALCLIIYAISAPTSMPAAPRFDAPESKPREPTATSGPTPTPEILEWQGDGDDIIQFEITGYEAVLVGAGQVGRRNFIVEIKQPNGRLVALAANCIGECESKKLVRLRGSGTYFVEITADGSWYLVIMPVE